MTVLAAITQLLGNKPIGFVDIGARGGAHPLVQNIAPAVAVLAFEPDVAEAERMRDDKASHGRYAKFEVQSVGISDREEQATLHELAASTNSSLLEPNRIFVERYDMSKWREVGRALVETTTLDAALGVVPHSDCAWGEAIKIDTQGTEFEILRGAMKTLATTSFLCIEVSFCELYRKQKLFSEIESFLRQIGFSFYGFDRMYYRSRKILDKRHQWGRERVIQADAYFFRDPFDSDSGRLDESTQRQRAIAAVFAYLTGFHDFALELLSGLKPDSLLLEKEVLASSRISPASAVNSVERLSRTIKADPESANVILGRFVDGRRHLNDYYDVG